MSRHKPDWDQLTEAYRIAAHFRGQKGKGPRSLNDRVRNGLLRTKLQFLPHYFGQAPRWRVWVRTLSGPRTMPDFACVGPIKSGSSDLSSYLNMHPNILPPLSKEVPTANTRLWPPYYPTLREKTTHREETGHALCGYFMPWMHNVELMDALRRVTPDARIVILLRDPVERAFSHYKWDLVRGRTPWRAATGRGGYYRSFDAYIDMALSLFPATPMPSRSGAPLLQSGIYVRSVRLWINKFGKDNVHVVRAEDYFKDVKATICAVHAFLGLPQVAPELHDVVNENPVEVARPTPETRERLRAFYRPWNERLYRLIDRDMGWT